MIDKAIDVLGCYLTDSAVAPLTKQFVEIESPLCTYISFVENVRASFTTLDVYFGSVPTGELDLLAEKFEIAIQRIVKDGIDMDRMRLVLKRERLKVRVFYSTIALVSPCLCFSVVKLVGIKRWGLLYGFRDQR